MNWLLEKISNSIVMFYVVMKNEICIEINSELNTKILLSIPKQESVNNVSKVDQNIYFLSHF